MNANTIMMTTSVFANVFPKGSYFHFLDFLF